jgi:hypothetical protein
MLEVRNWKYFVFYVRSSFFTFCTSQRTLSQKTLFFCAFEVPHREHRPFPLLRRIVVRDRTVLNCSCKLLIPTDFQEILHIRFQYKKISPVCADLFCADGENGEQSKNQKDKHGVFNIRFSQLYCGIRLEMDVREIDCEDEQWLRLSPNMALV